jgi:hypothetical protein
MPPPSDMASTFEFAPFRLDQSAGRWGGAEPCEGAVPRFYLTVYPRPVRHAPYVRS